MPWFARFHTKYKRFRIQHSHQWESTVTAGVHTIYEKVWPGSIVFVVHYSLYDGWDRIYAASVVFFSFSFIFCCCFGFCFPFFFWPDFWHNINDALAFSVIDAYMLVFFADICFILHMYAAFWAAFFYIFLYLKTHKHQKLVSWMCCSYLSKIAVWIYIGNCIFNDRSPQMHFEQ